MSKTKHNVPFISLNIAIMTVSGTRTEASDETGHYLRDAVLEAGHQVVFQRLLKEDLYGVRAQVANWIAEPEVAIILIIGGTGFTERDVSWDAVLPLLDREIPGYGELFRMHSFETIASSALQSRAFAGLANRTLCFAMPSSPGGCKTAWEQVINHQIDSRTRPCNFVGMLRQGEV